MTELDTEHLNRLIASVEHAESIAQNIIIEREFTEKTKQISDNLSTHSSYIKGLGVILLIYLMVAIVGAVTMSYHWIVDEKEMQIMQVKLEHTIAQSNYMQRTNELMLEAFTEALKKNNKRDDVQITQP